MYNKSKYATSQNTFDMKYSSQSGMEPSPSVCSPRERDIDVRQLAMLDTQVSRLNCELKRSQRNADDNEKRLRSRLQEMECNIRVHNDALKAKEAEAVIAKNRNNELQEIIKDLQSNCSDKSNMQGAHEKMKAEHDRMYLNIMKARRERGALEEELQATKHRLTELEMDAVELEHDKRSLETEARNCKRNAEKAFVGLEKRINRKLKQLQNDLKNERLENQELTAKFRALDREHEDMLPKSELMGKQLAKEVDMFQQKMNEMLDIHVNHLNQVKEDLLKKESEEENVDAEQAEEE